MRSTRKDRISLSRIRRPLSYRNRAVSAGSGDVDPAAALMPSRPFISGMTDDGALYHGTPSLEMGAAIFRNGFFISNNRAEGTQAPPGQGRRRLSRKFRSSLRSTERKTEGVVVERRIKNDPRLRILTLNGEPSAIPSNPKDRR